MTYDVTIRRLQTMDELLEMQQVEESVWQMSPNPVHQTFTAMHNGGIILGAFDGEKMIGFLYSFAGFDGQTAYLCSHMLGILPGYQSGGLGMRMKLKQFEFAKELGYPIITWTFDPLESLNAYLNIHKLGAAGAAYHVNHYGEMGDRLNKGLPTDRIQIEWITSEQKPLPATQLKSERMLTDVKDNHIPIAQMSRFTEDAGSWFVAIPGNFQALKSKNITLAHEWRKVTRKAFLQLFQNGYAARDVLRDPSRNISYYVFTKKSSGGY
ncbi:GNAT family N-acetyltransferase [Virgibacillus siamensis]|uniref:GNAT family N-acetyltransferase n=1 Tax=Virgibacillus siamensis TaxID=480071 RepID=UPI00098793A8|nr:GNAT family N-acetyltransferase [Virgibacillus siamensis]